MSRSINKELVKLRVVLYCSWLTYNSQSNYHLWFYIHDTLSNCCDYIFNSHGNVTILNIINDLFDCKQSFWHRYTNLVETVSVGLLEHVMVDRMPSLGKIATNYSVPQQSRSRQIPQCILFNDQLPWANLTWNL